MSATTPRSLEGTQAPSPFEQLWDRYRSLILTVVGAILVALVGNYAWRYFEQKGIDEKWSTFAVNLGARDIYTDQVRAFDGLTESLEDVELASLEQGAKSADAAQKPYYLLAIARKAMMTKAWDRAEAALGELEQGFPEHALVKKSAQPVQGRDPVEPKEEDETETSPPGDDEPRWVPATEGSVVSLMREQIAAARSFELPASFQKPEIPADAPRVKFTMGDYGSFTIALMPQAEAHSAKVLELAKESWWVGTAVDTIFRPTDRQPEQAHALHFGFASTKDDDRTKWTTTEPSEYELDYEDTRLSHFAGAVAARPGNKGKSAANRLWISIDDEANLDGTRVVFGYVVEGLDVLRSITEDAGLSAQDEELGRGRPTENIKVTAVEVL